MKMIKIIFICLLFVTLAAGCNMNEEGRETDQHGEVTNRNFGGTNISNSLGNPDLNFMNATNKPGNTMANPASLRVVDEAEDNIQNLPEVKHATIIASGRNAYVAVSLDDDFHGELNSNIEDQIAQRVRDADSAVHNVHISTDRQFVKQMRQYKDQLQQNGHAASGINNEFNSLVNRVFDHRR